MSKETKLFQEVNPAVYLLARVADRHFDATKATNDEWWRIHTRRNPRRTEELDEQIAFHSEMFDEINNISKLIPSLGMVGLADFKEFAEKSRGTYNPKILPGMAERAIRRITYDEIEVSTVRSGERPFWCPGLDEPWAGEPKTMQLVFDDKLDLDTLYRINEA